MRMILMDGSTRMTDVQNRWAFSSVTPLALRQGHNLYNPALSNTAQELTGETWGITYGDGGGASGNLVYTDIVDIGGLAVPSQAVELAQQVSNDFVYNELDGILGLAFSSLNTGMPDLMFAGS
jgi:Eukaryotic aspartyl protease